MNTRKFFRNPEVRKISLYTFIVFMFGIVAVYSLNLYIVHKMSERMINQNIAVIANVLQREDKASTDEKSSIEEDLAKCFTEAPTEENISEARKRLSEYGYNEDMSSYSNQQIRDLKSNLNIIFISFFVVFTITLFSIYVLVLKKIYINIDKAVNEVSSISSGKYKKISIPEEEGEISRLVNSLNYMGERVNNSIDLLTSEKIQLKDFLSDISHQLKTPLAALIMFVDIMKEKSDMPFEDRKNFLCKCEEQLQRMEWLVMNLLKVGRLEAGAIQFEMSMQKIGDSIYSSVNALKELAEKKNQSLDITGDLDSLVYHDSDWISESISNIVKNAIEHTPDNGKIKIVVKRGPLITKILISDNGSGIPKDMQKNIFKRFYKGENSVDPKSIGIGLYLSKAIIESHKGDIKLESEVGAYTTFIISLYNDKI